jgi:hypothetical protein
VSEVVAGDLNLVQHLCVDLVRVHVDQVHLLADRLEG